MSFAIKTPHDAAIDLKFSSNTGPLLFFSVHLISFDFLFLRQKKRRPSSNTKLATPPTTPPTMLPISAFPDLGKVRGASLSPRSGSIMPAGSSVGVKFATDVVLPGCLAAGRFVFDIGDCTLVELEASGAVTTGVGPFEAAGAVNNGACVEDICRDRLVAMMNELESVDVGIRGGAGVVVTAACNDSAVGPISS